MSGPSGPVAATFPFYMSDIKGRKKEFMYQGSDDLDECLYPTGANVAIPIEAKVTAHYDTSWHKLGFPCHRFFKRSISLRTRILPKVIPVYCMFDDVLRKAYIYVFPAIDAAKASHGMVLNDRRQLTPKEVYKVDIMRSLRY